ncbi:cyclic di-GMP phosphodiesterase YfgF [mine drainage metagenome]|uniref:Cyclic di-GMP phosphodiesterase YfgF n=1 Tax=mine drainage metagenome TaxID=410659 RepID=A0A1J5R667_9ZZZZ
MKFRFIFRAVRPFFSALAVIVTAGALVFAIYFTGLGLQWITFLGGILVAAVLAEASRVSHVEWVVARRTAQLSAVKDKLEQETQRRKRAEETISMGNPRLRLIDEVLPVMVAFFDTEGQCQYHNRAFTEWLHLRPDQIHGQHIRKILGSNVYQETATSVRQSLDGRQVQYERTQKMPDGAVYRLRVEHIPQFGEDGKVGGFFMLINDITSPRDLQKPADTGSEKAGIVADANAPVPDEVSNQDTFVESFSEQISGHTEVINIRAAIEKGDFSLYCQLITPLATGSGETGHYEILVRLIEEEEGMMPPGAFFPLAEKYGLMPHLDRWVVQHVAEWASHQSSPAGSGKDSVYFINLSDATIGDPSFPEFLQLTLMEHGVPGGVLCFEIPNSELTSRPAVVAEFAQRIRQCGSLLAISGFGHDRISFDLIRGFRVEFLKIDGNIIFNILRDPVELAKITAINRVAKLIGVKTIAELVENEETIAKLREVGIDYAQGFGISKPRPLSE